MNDYKAKIRDIMIDATEIIPLEDDSVQIGRTPMETNIERLLQLLTEARREELVSLMEAGVVKHDGYITISWDKVQERYNQRVDELKEAKGE